MTLDYIRTIEEWIDCGCLIDAGDGAAFDVWFQTANPNTVDEPIPVEGSGEQP